MLIFWVLGFSLLGSIGSIAGASLLLVFPDAVRRKFVPCLISYASGTLIGAAFLGMIPAGIKGAPVRDVMAAVLLGLVLF